MFFSCDRISVAVRLRKREAFCRPGDSIQDFSRNGRVVATGGYPILSKIIVAWRNLRSFSGNVSVPFSLLRHRRRLDGAH